MALEYLKKGFPKFLANGSHKSSNNGTKKFIVMSWHGHDLKILHKVCGKVFSYKTVLNIGIEMV